MNTNGATRSFWMTSATLPAFPSLPGDTETDVCVIGGGIAGLTTAYLLSREGRRVVLLEAMDSLAGGETGRTTAHFMPPDDRYFHIAESFGEEASRKVARSFKLATDLAETIAGTESPDCNFQRLDGYLYCLPGQDKTILDKELAAARQAGVTVEPLPQVPGLVFDTGPCIRFAHQAQFHPLRYLAGMARACARHGVALHCGTRALEIGGDAQRQVVKTSHGDVHASAVVVATNTPFNDRVVMHTKQSGYRTYVVAMEVPMGSVPPLLLWDTGDPYYYVRLAASEPASATDLLIVGGADHKVGQDTHPQHRWDEIERWVRERFPMAGATAHRWSGQVMEPADPLAFFGRNPMDDKNVFIITGDSGTGMTHCTAGAIAVTDLIMGRSNPWADIYDPARKATHGLAEFVKEQANTLAQYKELLTGGDVNHPDQIAPGQGAVVRQGVHKLAVYRDEASTLHVRSAVCTHLGCVVAWNPAEKSWDCPCHASRFGIDGSVLHGPAGVPLPEAQLDTPGS
ncbi:FAD-dependent oxidoreductase [Ideonella sp. BN130291]|uniref:FAD-dependent oxidoreductase n=1 Tax=Ideonella sp. BN130291 TaxID=3112940 RepID=UPI002E26E1C8|nr:FAD-dependent oxidoreductase [Ideonella sp. BN130291]